MCLVLAPRRVSCAREERKVPKSVEQSKSQNDRFDHRHNARSDWRQLRAKDEPSDEPS
jgi:hypothetical protein